MRGYGPQFGSTAAHACMSFAASSQGVAGAVSITNPLIILIAIFQKQIVSGLTQGAVKG